MTYEIVFAPSARRDLHRLPPAICDAVLTFVQGDLAEKPHRVGKPLGRELAGRFSARRGVYRIIYSIHDEQVLVRVINIRHRADAYRR